MEIKRYGIKINSLFDLIDGHLETKETLALSFTLAKAESAMDAFLSLLGLDKKLFRLNYIVDSEAQNDSKRLRVDILIRFYDGCTPVHAIVIEAKQVGVNVNLLSTIGQVSKYNAANGFSQLTPFGKNVSYVTLTKDVALVPVSSQFSCITWASLVTKLYDLKRPLKEDIADVIADFIKFITKIEGGMKYYEEEILAIPAGTTSYAVQSSGIYACPNSKKYTHKKSLYVAFKKRNGGEMDTLYKLREIYILDLNNQDNINDIDKRLGNGFAEKVERYKKAVKYPASVHEEVRVYDLDLDSQIHLPHPVRPLSNNVSRGYYLLSEFFQTPNSHSGRVIVQKSIRIKSAGQSAWSLEVKPSQGDTYTLYDHGNLMDEPGVEIVSFSTEGRYNLDTTVNYRLVLSNASTGKLKANIDIRFVDSKWNVFYRI